jgi:hypothetical protein
MEGAVDGTQHKTSLKAFRDNILPIICSRQLNRPYLEANSWLAIETSQRPPQDEIPIGVLGVTGSGETTFISKVTGRTDLVIGNTLEAC